MKRIMAGLILLLSFSLSVEAQDIIEYNFRVEGACGMCKSKIDRVAKKEGLAEKAVWNVDSKILAVEINEALTSISVIKYRLAEAGYDNGDFTAPQEVYDGLHSCCKYRVLSDEEAADEHDKLINNVELNNFSPPSKAEGYIYATEDGAKIPLIGANISFEGAETGTTTDTEGYFTLPNDEQHTAIRISYIGYEDQLVPVKDSYMEITMADGHQLETVEINYRQKTTSVSFVNTINAESISREELCKAACCNLSESFETNPSVDVSFSDAITGAKQIQMLGLAGPYVQITRELIPDVRNMNSISGLNTTPGPWIQSIQLIKGTGSVVNGFESFTGQINVELKKPERDEILHINGFVNNGGRVETNVNLRQDVTEHISTGILFHGKVNNSVHDRNEDGFTDMPTEKDYVIANSDHFTGASENHADHWRMRAETQRLDLWSKTGFIFPERPEMSIGLQLSTSFHNQDAEYGFQRYNADELALYSNLIFQNIFDNGHIIRTGLTYQKDKLEELVDKSGFYTRDESVPGAYVEYTWKKGDKWAIIPGLRIDQHNNYGAFITPRIHAKYNLGDQSILRFTGGRGQRTASIFSEHLSIFASNRAVEIRNPSSEDLPYGLEAEVAWNYGVNYTQGFRIAEKEVV